MGSAMDGVIEYVDIKYDRGVFARIFEAATGYAPLAYRECGAQSWVLNTNPLFVDMYAEVLSAHARVHDRFCKYATGFNFNKTNSHTVPPHVDIDKRNYFNLLIPVFGVARLDIFETRREQLEFRHGETHWMMLRDGVPAIKVGSLLVDRPVLLNTRWLHSVQPEISPRCVWCTRWIDIDEAIGFAQFKRHVEGVLNE
jgi:hypothetical protein